MANRNLIRRLAKRVAVVGGVVGRFGCSQPRAYRFTAQGRMAARQNSTPVASGLVVRTLRRAASLPRRHGVEAGAAAFRARGRGLDGHGVGEFFDELAPATTPAEVAGFFALLELHDGVVEILAGLIEDAAEGG